MRVHHVAVTLDCHDLLTIPVQRLEDEVKRRLARELTVDILKDVKFTERLDPVPGYAGLDRSKEMLAEIVVTNRETLEEYNALKSWYAAGAGVNFAKST